jgi:hypothetical protein
MVDLAMLFILQASSRLPRAEEGIGQRARSKRVVGDVAPVGARDSDRSSRVD